LEIRNPLFTRKKQPLFFFRLGYLERFLLISILLGLFGVFMVLSASATFGRNAMNSDSFFFLRQVSFYALGLFVCWIATKMPTENLEKYSFFLLGLSFALMSLVLIPGIGELKYGARRWIRIFGLGIQPSEIFKFAVVVWVADFLKRKGGFVSSLTYGVMPLVFFIGVSAWLFLMQPDFGNLFLLAVTVFMMGYTAGVRRMHIFYLFVILFLGSLLAIFTNPYRLQRLSTYLDPWADPNDTGFQLINSMIAFGSGGIFGKGLGNSLQKQYYLPFPQTDFIFASIGEELGFLGVFGLLFCFLILLHSGLKVASLCKDLFARYYCFGITLLIALQALLHFGVVIGSLPTKGIGLPFISYGGSSLVTYYFAVGWFYNLGKTQKNKGTG